MIESVLKYIKENKSTVLIFIMFLVTMFALLYTNYKVNNSHKEISEIEYVDSLGTYYKIYYEEKFSKLKNENRELYDSLKSCKDEIDYLIQFTHEKHYESGIVYTKPNSAKENEASEKDTIEYKTFKYLNQPNDTLRYELLINAEKEPRWYSFKADIKNTFTIVNKSDYESALNQLSIKSDDGGTISDVTVYNRKDTRKVKDRISIGPTVAVGYDVIAMKPTFMVGVGITFDLSKKK